MQYQLVYAGVPQVIKRHSSYIKYFKGLVSHLSKKKWRSQMLQWPKLWKNFYSNLLQKLNLDNSFIEKLCNKQIKSMMNLKIFHFRNLEISPIKSSNYKSRMAQAQIDWQTYSVLLKQSFQIEKINFLGESLYENRTNQQEQKMWRKISISVGTKCAYTLETTGVEILKLIPQNERSGTFQIFYWFYSALKRKETIKNTQIREYLTSNIKLNLRYELFGKMPFNEQEDSENFEKLIDCLLYFNVPIIEICHLCDLLAACILLGGVNNNDQVFGIIDEGDELNSTGSLDTLDIFNLLIQSNVTIEQLENIECYECKASIKLYNNDNIRSSLIFIYQVICDWISNVISSYKNSQFEVIHLIFSGNFLQNQNHYDLNFADLIANLTHELLISKHNLEKKFNFIFSDNSFQTSSELIKKLQQCNFVSATNKFQNNLIELNGNTTYDLTSMIQQNHFSLKPTVQEILLQSKNILLQKYSKQIPTTAMHYIWKKVTQFIGLRLPNQQSSREAVYEDTLLISPQSKQLHTLDSEPLPAINVVTCNDSEQYFRTLSRANSVDSFSSFNDESTNQSPNKKLIRTMSTQQAYQQGRVKSNGQEQNQENQQSGQQILQQFKQVAFKEVPSEFSPPDEVSIHIQKFTDFNEYSENSSSFKNLSEIDSKVQSPNHIQQNPLVFTQTTKTKIIDNSGNINYLHVEEEYNFDFQAMINDEEYQGDEQEGE